MQIDLLTRLNPEPTDLQLALFRRHKAAGTTPGNPKWYKSQVIKPFEFKKGLPAKLPQYATGAQWNAKHNGCSVCRGQELVTRYKDGSELVRIV